MAGVEEEDEYKDAVCSADPPPSSPSPSPTFKSKPAAAAAGGGGLGSRLFASIPLHASLPVAIGRFSSPKPPAPIVAAATPADGSGTPTSDAASTISGPHLLPLASLPPRHGEDRVAGLGAGMGEEDLGLVPAEEQVWPTAADREKECLAVDECSANRNDFSSRGLEEEEVVEQCQRDELGATVDGCMVQDQEEVMEQEGATKDCAVVEDQNSNAAVEQCAGNETRAVMYAVEVNEKVTEQEGAVNILDAAEVGVAVGSQEEEEDVVVAEQGEDFISAQDQLEVVELCTGDQLRTTTEDNADHDQDLVEQEEASEYYTHTALEAVEQCTNDGSTALKDGNIVEEEERAVELEGALGVLDAAKDGAPVELQEEDVVVAEQEEDEDFISVQDQHKVVDQCSSDQLITATDDNTAQGQDVVKHEGATEYYIALEAVEQCTNGGSRAVKDGNVVEEKVKVAEQVVAVGVLYAAKDYATGESQEKGDVVVAEQIEDSIFVQDQHKVELFTGDQLKATADDNAAQEQEGSTEFYTTVEAVEECTNDESRVAKYGNVVEEKERPVKQEGAGDNVVECQEVVEKDGAIFERGAATGGTNVEDQDKGVEQYAGDESTKDENAVDGYADGDQEASRENIGFSAGYPQMAAKQNCYFYKLNRSCSYGSSCHFNHPQTFPIEQKNHEVEFLELNRVGLPIREGASNCVYYMLNHKCKYGKKCCFNHPEQVLDAQLHTPTRCDNTNLQSSPVSKKSTEHATINDMPSGSDILPSEIFIPNVPPCTEEKEMKTNMDYWADPYPLRIKPDLIIICEEKHPDPFLYKEKEMRSLFANHNHPEDLLQHYEHKDEFGLRPMLAGQTGRYHPSAWKHIRLGLLGCPEWVTFILRLDNVYAKGFSILRDGHELCYEITEPVESGVEAPRIRYLNDGYYRAEALHWDVKYREFFGCTTDGALEAVFRSILVDVDFVPDAIRFLSKFDPRISDINEAKWKVGGLIFRLCEYPRMNLRGLDFPLVPWIHKWSVVCKFLKEWRTSEFTIWDPKKVLKKVLGVNSVNDALNRVHLVLNFAEHHLDSDIRYMDKMKKKQEQKDRNDKGHGDGPGKGGRPAGPGNSAGNNGEEPPIADGTSVPCGRRRVQILSMVAQRPIGAIIVYDWHRGQTVFCLHRHMGEFHHYDFNAGQKLQATGPRRPIGADGPVSIELHLPYDIYIFGGVYGVPSCSTFLDLSDSYYEDDEGHPTIHTMKLEGYLDISYMLIPNTVECEVSVKLLRCWGGRRYIDGTVEAWNKSYGDHRVKLFDGHDELPLTEPLHTIPLHPSVFCVPYQQKFEVHIEVDLSVDGERFKASLLFTPGITCLEVSSVSELGVEVGLIMSPDLLPYTQRSL